ncbi:MAG: glycosyltransferase family 4 protein [Candidatus Omnitrophica bacterium]|nr:glycosyltransferase family 4 protein [Candidatus Omnitrophota bacterium]
MRIALYYPWIYLKSGIERTILEIKKRSRHQWTIFTSHFDIDSTYPEFKDIEVIELKRISVRRSYLRVLEAAIKIIFQRIELKDFDCLWVHSEGLGDLITFRNHKKPVICFCHTPLKIIHDPFIRQVYLKNNPFKKPLFVISSFIFKIIDKLAWRNYRGVFAVSKEVKERILKAKLISPEKVEVIYRGIDLEKIKPTWVYESYLFHPTRIKWWKNIELGIEAFKLFQKINPKFNNFKLIIAGQIDKESINYYRKLLNLSKENPHIEIIADPTEEKMSTLYSNCYAVLSTTLNEDWGITILEAMAYGKPVIAINQGGPKESIIDMETGFLVEPSVEDYSQAIKNLVDSKDLVIELGKKARGESLKYSWNNFIKKIDDYIDSLKNKY